MATDRTAAASTAGATTEVVFGDFTAAGAVSGRAADREVAATSTVSMPGSLAGPDPANSERLGVAPPEESLATVATAGSIGVAAISALDAGPADCLAGAAIVAAGAILAGAGVDSTGALESIPGDLESRCARPEVCSTLDRAPCCVV
ncbi:MAG: hypothetical protein K0U70_14295 [Actinomycetia bacterium]|nr:hypothetical protein [Actinomycetes bacterium]MCH9768960.1 hypothetical protein [Actinomycetes bacterium]